MKKSADPNSDKLKAEFRQKLENFQSPPSDSLWDKIELGLDKQEAQVYKNRMRIYSRLAAACLVLLLAFGVVLIPKQLEQLKGKSPETASAQNTRHPLKKKSGDSSVPAKNDSLSGEKTIRQIPGQNQTLAFYTEVNAITETENKVPKRNSINEKPAGFEAENVKTKKIAPGLAATQSDAIAFAPKTKTPETNIPQTNTAATTTTEISETSSVNPGNTMATISETITAREIAVAPEMPASDNNFTASGITKIPKTSMDAASSRNNAAQQTALKDSEPGTFQTESPTVSANSDTREDLPYLKSQTATTPQAEPSRLNLPETASTENPESEKPTDPEKTAIKRTRWILTSSYSARHFNAGMRLATKAEIDPANNLASSQQQQQNLSAYQTAIHEFNENTRSAYSQGFGVTVGYKLSDNWLVQTGFTYSRHRAQTTAHYAFRNQGFGNIGNSGATSPQTVDMPQTTLQTVLENNFYPASTQTAKTTATQTNYTFEQVGLPVNLRFQTNFPDYYFFVGAGFSCNLLTNASIETESQQTSYPAFNFPGAKAEISSLGVQENTFRSWMPALGLQTGLGYRISGHWQIEMALEGDRFLKPLISDENAAGTRQKKPLSLGASLSLGYSF